MEAAVFNSAAFSTFSAVAVLQQLGPQPLRNHDRQQLGLAHELLLLGLARLPIPSLPSATPKSSA